MQAFELGYHCRLLGRACNRQAASCWFELCSCRKLRLEALSAAWAVCTWDPGAHRLQTVAGGMVMIESRLCCQLTELIQVQSSGCLKISSDGSSEGASRYQGSRWWCITAQSRCSSLPEPVAEGSSRISSKMRVF